MTHQHTPGPWDISQVDENNAAEIGGYVATVHWVKIESGQRLEDDSEAAANANLIAAAPDLLVALEDVLNMVEEPEGPYYHGARRALAKARGY